MRRQRVSGRTTAVAAVTAVLVAAGAVGGWNLLHPDASAATTTTITATATRGTVRQTVTTTGTLAPARRADLAFAVPGTVTTVPVAVGDKVAKGAVLATVGADALQAQVDAAQAQVDATEGQVTASAGGTAAAVASARAQLAAAQSSLSRAQASLAQATLRAPFAGTVAAVTVEVGDSVGSGSGSGGGSGTGGSGSGGAGSGGSSTGSGSSAAVTVISTGSWVVDASVAAADLAQVRSGLQAQITPDGSNQTVFGTVKSVGVMASTGSAGAATFPVTIAVTGSPSGLYAGGSVTAAIVVRQLTDVLTVPSAAITSEGGQTYVTVASGAKQTRTKVVVGAVLGASTQITSGLSEGQTVVVRRLQLPTGVGSGGTRQRGQGGQGGFGGFRGGFPGGGQGGGQGSQSGQGRQGGQGGQGSQTGGAGPGAGQ